MKKLLLVLLVAGGGYFLWQYTQKAPERAYREFAEAWARGQTDQAMRYADGDKIRRALQRFHIRGMPVQMEAFHGAKSEILAVKKMREGEVSLEATQRVTYDPPGATSAIGGTMLATFRHVVRIRETPAGWRVVDFEASFLDATQTRP